MKERDLSYNGSRYFNFITKLRSENKLLIGVCTILALVSIVLAATAFKLASTSKTVILPPKVDREFWVAEDSLSTAYFEQVGFYIADRVMSVSPLSAVNAYDALLPFLSDDPKETAAIRQTLLSQAEFIKKENLYQIFYPLKVEVNGKAKQVTVIGTMRKYIGEMYIHEINSSLTLKYAVSNGRIKIKAMEIK